MEESTVKSDTVQVQICLKDYDMSKKFDIKVQLPFKKRNEEKVLIVGDEKLGEVAKANGLPFVLFGDVAGKDKEKKRRKKKLASAYHSIIVGSGMFNKYFEITFMNNKRTPFYILKPNVDLKSFYDEVSRTVRLKLRNEPVISFPSGTLDMSSDEVAQNIHTVISALVTNLKVDARRLGSVHLKSRKSKPIKLN